MLGLLQQQVKKYTKQSAERSRLKALANEIRGWSKQAAALLRRDNTRASKAALLEAERLIKSAVEYIKQYPELRFEGFYTEALEEYAEAKILYNFLHASEQKFPVFTSLSPEEIIGGMCDATGELVRKAITEAGDQQLKKIETYRTAIEEISQTLTTLGLQGKLRHKYDDVERNLQRIENIIYDMNMKK